MQFDRWHPLADAPAHAPDAPGVFQVRLARGLAPYPRGKSAMVHSGASARSVREAVAALAARRAGAPWLCRWATGPVRDPAAELAVLLRRFVDRFGQPPHPPDSPAVAEPGPADRGGGSGFDL
jgi:hypothetical protein